MAKLYLGNKEITPAIVVGNTDPVPFGRYRIENGVAISNNGYTLTGHEFDGITEIGENALREEFSAGGFVGVSLNGELSFHNLKNIKKTGLDNAFVDQKEIKIGSFDALETIEERGMDTCFYNASTSGFYEPYNISFPLLKKVGKQGMRACFGCSFDVVRFDSLDDVGDSALSLAFSYGSVNEIYFNSLKTTSFNGYTNAFYYMLPYGSITVHFPSNLETTIQGLDGYPTFGGTNTVLAFDLPATS